MTKNDTLGLLTCSFFWCMDAHICSDRWTADGTILCLVSKPDSLWLKESCLICSKTGVTRIFKRQSCAEMRKPIIRWALREVSHKSCDASRKSCRWGRYKIVSCVEISIETSNQGVTRLSHVLAVTRHSHLVIAVRLCVCPKFVVIVIVVCMCRCVDVCLCVW